MSISMLRLKSGVNLHRSSVVGMSRGIEDNLLVLGVVLAHELLALGRDVHPETAFTADGAGAFNDKANLVGRVAGRWQVDVLAAHVWRAVISERQKVDGLRLLQRRSHWHGD